MAAVDQALLKINLEVIKKLLSLDSGFSISVFVFFWISGSSTGFPGRVSPFFALAVFLGPFFPLKRLNVVELKYFTTLVDLLNKINETLDDFFELCRLEEMFVVSTSCLLLVILRYEI